MAAPKTNFLSSSDRTRAFRWVAVCLLALWPAALAVAQSTPFVHPGLLHTRADLARIKAQLAAGAQPWKGGLEKLQADGPSKSDWRVRGPFANVVRGGSESRRIAELESDSNAAYQNALLWCLTADEAHAKKSAEILRAWALTLHAITGHDKELAAALCGFKLVNAAELLRHTWPGWQPADSAAVERMLRTVFYPVIKDFAPFANGNWGTACIKTLLAMGVFLDDRPMFESAVDYYRNGAGDGRLTHYIINETGQCQESGRDQAHTQLGLGHLADACEIAWHQGLDLYGEAHNRLLAGFEYTAQYNLGQEVPFALYTDSTGKYKARVISGIDRNKLRPIYEMVWNHYTRRRGLPAPFTQMAAEKIRPEGSAKGADHPGFGTLLFSLPPTTPKDSLFGVPPALLKSSPGVDTYKLPVDGVTQLVGPDAT